MLCGFATTEVKRVSWEMGEGDRKRFSQTFVLVANIWEKQFGCVLAERFSLRQAGSAAMGLRGDWLPQRGRQWAKRGRSVLEKSHWQDTLCGCLNENIPHRLRFLNNGSQLVALFGKVQEMGPCWSKCVTGAGILELKDPWHLCLLCLLHVACSRCGLWISCSCCYAWHLLPCCLCHGLSLWDHMPK